MKSSWIGCFDDLSAIVNQADPVQLIAGGAPTDEYEIEILEIFLQIKTFQINRQNIYEQIFQIFQKNFGEDEEIDDKKIHEIGIAIVDSGLIDRQTPEISNRLV